MATPKRIFKLIAIFLLVSLIGFGKGNQPKNIEEAIRFFEKKWSGNTLRAFKSKSETEAMRVTHLGVGQWIRNEWIHNTEDTLLRGYFRSMGIFHPDDMSSIILTSLHRKLNKLPLEIENQVAGYLAFWRKTDCENEAYAAAKEHYWNIDSGDSLAIYLPVRTSSEGVLDTDTLICSTPNREFNPEKDLCIKAVLVEKLLLGKYEKRIFQIRVTALNRNQIRTPWGILKIGETYDIEILYLKIKVLP